MANVLLLGSGFSRYIAKKAGLDLPVTKYFIQAVKSLLNESTTKAQSQIDAMRNLLDCVERIEKVRTGEPTDIEQLYDSIDIAARMHEHFWVEKRFPVEPDQLLAQIKFMIAFLLMSRVKENRLPLMKACSEELRKYDPGYVLTLNWDTILDEVFDDFYIRPQTDRTLFGFQWYGFKPGHAPLDVQQSELLKAGVSDSIKDGTSLIKLHGSVNWFECRDAKHVEVKQARRSYEWIGDDVIFRCRMDHSKLDPLILPPSSSKNYVTSPFPAIWRKAFEALMRADKLVIFGCSLRPADFYLNDLLFKALIRKGESPEVTVIDKTPLRIAARLKKLGFDPGKIKVQRVTA